MTAHLGHRLPLPALLMLAGPAPVAHAGAPPERTDLRLPLGGRVVVVDPYVAGGDGLGSRRDLASLNLSDVPTVMVELGNMRDRGDAALMTSRSGRERFARASADAAQSFVAP